MREFREWNPVLEVSEGVSPCVSTLAFQAQGAGTIIFAEGAGVTIVSLLNNLTVKAAGGGGYLVKTAINTWGLMGDLV